MNFLDYNAWDFSPDLISDCLTAMQPAAVDVVDWGAGGFTSALTPDRKKEQRCSSRLLSHIVR